MKTNLTCAFYVPNDSEGRNGTCRRFPPNIDGRWPKVKLGCFCGERVFQPEVFTKEEKEAVVRENARINVQY